MPIIKVTAADMAKLANIKQGWYGAVITKIYEPKTAKSGTSINYAFDFTIEGAVTNGGQPIPGKTIKQTFNSELIGTIGQMYEAVTGNKLEEGGDVDTDILLNKKCDVKCGQRAYEGTMYDEIQGFMPYGKSKEAVPF